MSKSKKAKPAAAKIEKITGDVLPKDGSIPPVLDRTKGKTKAQIDAERDALIARDKARSSKQTSILRGVTSPAPKADNLTDADKKAIEELSKAAAQKNTVKTGNRIAKLKAKQAGDTSKLPATGKDALAVINATPAKEATVTKQTKGKTATKGNGKKKMPSSEKADNVFRMLSRKNGASNAEFVSELGFRWNVGPMKALCKARGVSLKINRASEGQPMRYVAVK